jgi:regulator of cell morphogenesis and NO signaling
MEKIEMNDINEKIADMVLRNHFLLLVLERFGINLGLQEKIVKDICAEHNINTSVFLAICNLHINPNEIPELNIQIEDIRVIVNYLKNTHEYYKTEVLPKVSEQIKSITENNKDLTFILIERFFEEYKQEVFKHLEYEETKVFPYAMDLISGNNKTIDYKIKDYKNHHQDIETKLLDLKNLLIKHLPEKNDQVFRRNLLFELFRFEKDLRIHTIIEENILVTAIENLENNKS